MQRLAVLVLVLSSVAVSPAAMAADRVDPCLKKRSDIVRQIDQARQRGNDQRVAGLTKALRAQEATCTPDSLRRARDKDIADASRKVDERERELQEARRDGKDARKIAQREAKLKEAQRDLAQARLNDSTAASPPGPRTP